MRIPIGKHFFTSVLKWSFIVFLVTGSAIMLIGQNVLYDEKMRFAHSLKVQQSPLLPPKENWRNLWTNQTNKLSVLGQYLYLDKTPPSPQDTDKIYTILTWKVGQFLEKRHIYHFTNHKFDPFEKCSVRNCEITYKEKDLPNADAVMIHLQRLKGVQDLPKEYGPRPENQRWVFLTDENPLFTFLRGNVQIKEFNGKFNWSMTYRMESDVPVPYGRTILKNRNYTNSNQEYNDVDYNYQSYRKKSDVLVAVMGSNCGGKNHRWQYVKELQKYLKVDFYGKCGTLKCPGHFSKDCDILSNYKFYLSFENSNCAQYITEKLWWNAYAKNAIPIVMGASKADYSQLLPPRSYINIEDFARPADLARYILYVNNTNSIYNSFFEWKKYYQIANEHGYFQSDSYHYCRLCEALNYNSKQKKVYDKLEKFWAKTDCYPRWDE